MDSKFSEGEFSLLSLNEGIEIACNFALRTVNELFEAHNNYLAENHSIMKIDGFSPYASPDILSEAREALTQSYFNFMSRKGLMSVPPR